MAGDDLVRMKTAKGQIARQEPITDKGHHEGQSEEDQHHLGAVADHNAGHGHKTQSAEKSRGDAQTHDDRAQHPGHPSARRKILLRRVPLALAEQTDRHNADHVNGDDAIIDDGHRWVWR